MVDWAKALFRASDNSCRAVSMAEASRSIELVVRGVTSVSGHVVPITVLAGTLNPVSEGLQSCTTAELSAACHVVNDRATSNDVQIDSVGRGVTKFK